MNKIRYVYIIAEKPQKSREKPEKKCCFPAEIIYNPDYVMKREEKYYDFGNDLDTCGGRCIPAGYAGDRL